jgi:uncharacterized protein YjbI with pentapeptide repeats
MVWVPGVAADAQEGASGLTATARIGVQATPTEDATVTALNKEKLAQEVQQLKNQNETDFLSLLRTNASILLSTLIIVIGGLIGLFRWFGDRRDEREKRAEERFQSVVTGLGDEKEGAKIGAAILLRTFLRPGYEEFYTQTFDLAVANLRRDALVVSVGTRTADPPQDSKKAPLPLTTLSQALIVVFKEAFPLARSQEKRSPQSLDATGIQLDNAYLRRADLEQVRMPQASLRGADLSLAKLSGAKLWWADLSGADLEAADLSRANLSHAILSQVNLSQADLRRAILREVNLEAALSLKDTDLRQVIGLTKEQLEICKAKGAIIDEDAVASSTLSTVSSAVQSTTAQVPSAPSAQVNTPTPGTDGSSDLPSKPSNGA